MSWKETEGCPWPLGATWIAEQSAYNFAVFAGHSKALRLLLYRSPDDPTPLLAVDFDPSKHKSDDVWHCRVKASEMVGATCYAYRTQPTEAVGAGQLFPVGKELLDPYAKRIALGPGFDRKAAIGGGSNAGRAIVAQLPASNAEPFDWENDRRPRHEEDLVIYEMHVRGFTQNRNSGVPAFLAGGYLGVIEKIPHLTELGITAVELMPIFQFEPECENYWGYMPIGFFSPHCYFANSAETAVTEFRTMVKALHSANIEVILDVVYNHTAEAGADGPCYGMKGLDNTSYYLTEGMPANRYLDFSGTGNTLNSSSRAVRRLVLDSLRYWVKEMHVDGFRFDLASVFSRNPDGSINMGDPPIFAEMADDPELAGSRLIAEPWDAGGAYQLGRNFPGQNWFQWNGKFRDDVRRFVRSEPGLIDSMMTRLYGSDDLFPDDVASAKHAYQSINYCASHDGFTLYDSVAYEQKHNEANGANNTDGPSDDLSWNCGFEGDIDAPAKVLNLRQQQVRNFFAILMLSNGTPMFRMGDEFLQTQRGNSNPWNQDNETSWLDWNRLQANPEIFRFFKCMIRFRKENAICRSRFWRDDVRWHGLKGVVDRSWDSRSLAFFLRAPEKHTTDLYVMINMYWEELDYEIQEPGAWTRIIDTTADSPNDFIERKDEIVFSTNGKVGARSVTVFCRQRST